MPRVLHRPLIVATILVAACGARVRPGTDAGPRAETPPSPPASPPTEACPPAARRPYAPTPAVEERDRILTLLAFAIAYDDWQTDERRGRGRNIAAVLADAEGHVRCWGRNSVVAEDDATQHAEVRALGSYLRANAGTHADGLRLYSTLEPCVMCAGMTLMTGLDVVLFGEHAARSGATYDRLLVDAHDRGGPCPYTFDLVAAEAPLDLVARLDEARDRTSDRRGWMTSEARRAIHEEAARRLDAFVVHHPENESVLAEARRFRARVPLAVPASPYRIGCPSFEDVR